MGGVVDVGQYLIVIDFVVGGEGVDDCEQMLVWYVVYWCKLICGRNYYVNFIVVINFQLVCQLFVENNVIFVCLQIVLFDVYQVWSQRIVLCWINVQYNFDCYVVCVLQYYVVGGDWCYVGYFIKFCFVFWQLLRVY